MISQIRAQARLPRSRKGACEPRSRKRTFWFLMCQRTILHAVSLCSVCAQEACLGDLLPLSTCEPTRSPTRMSQLAESHEDVGDRGAGETKEEARNRGCEWGGGVGCLTGRASNWTLTALSFGDDRVNSAGVGL